jgi:uncharacterized membrane protein
MKLVQYTSGLSTLLFMVKIYLTKSFEAQMDCFLAVIILILIFILTSHFIGMEKINNDIADEIKRNHFNKKNRSSSDNRL